MRTSPKLTAAPASPSSFSTTITSPGWTRYCFPPVLITAYIWKPQRERKKECARQETLRAKSGDIYGRASQSQRERAAFGAKTRAQAALQRRCGLICRCFAIGRTHAQGRGFAADSFNRALDRYKVTV